MEETVRHAIIKQELIAPGDQVLVALSGGPDSVCLLHLLHGLAPSLDFSLRAAHLDHGIRSESAEEADFVRQLCGPLGIPLTVERVEVPAQARRRRLGIEETAREVRREFLLRVAAQQGCRVIALGHHRGDQAETVLHRLLRGSGGTGLAGMRPHTLPFIRPLLAFPRSAILAYLHRHGLTWVEDASNLDRTFTRNRIRLELLPLLRSFNPRIEEGLSSLGRRLALEEDFWDVETARAFSVLNQQEGEGVRLDRPRLLALHPALRARVLREAVRQARGDLRGVGALHLAALDRLLNSERPQAEVHLPGLWGGRRYDALLLRRQPPDEPRACDVEISGPGLFPLPGGWLRVELAVAALGEGRLTVEFAQAEAPFPLRVRSPRPGDRFRPSGLGGHKKLKDYFIDARVDREARWHSLIVEGEEILWLIGRRRCEGRSPKPGETVLRLVFEPLQP